MSLANPPKARSPQGNPYTPPLPNPQIMEKFGGINTSTTRAGVPDEMCYWIDGFMPIAPRNARTLPDAGPQLRGAFSATILCFGFFNIGAQPYAVHFLSDGSVQVVTTTGTITTTQILPPATITTPSITNIGFSQWGQTYLLIVANQTNGYWIWDGTNVYEAGVLSPIVTLTNPGQGYQTVPSVTASGGQGMGAVFAAQIANGVVTGVSIVNPGSGCLAGQTVSLDFHWRHSSGLRRKFDGDDVRMLSGTGATIALTSLMLPPASLLECRQRVMLVAGGSGYSPFHRELTAVCALSAVVYHALIVDRQLLLAGTITASHVIGAGGSYNDEPLPTLLIITDNGDYYVSGVSIVAARFRL